ncbi:homoserine kinase [Candidatus Pelagibacter bacterium nBUS_44]|uniref:homoserine kinase n=1 Tax=Candidatus Pelagibacter bacterium nBUS_44 TaxID=3374195 RepID=UPI003EBAEA35
MAVYTKINKKDIVSINDQYEIEKITHFKGIKKGIENTNYLLKTKKNKFILTIFEKRVSNKEIPFFMRLMETLNNSNINCPKPLKSKNGSVLIKLKNKKACIVSFINGKDKIKLNLKNCFEIGKVIANIHEITKNIKISRKNSMGIKELEPLLKRIKFKSKKFANLQKFLTNNLKEIKKNWPSKLPQGVIHGDLFIDNIFFNKDKLSGVIDFYFAANDYFMYEIAICINALCFDFKKSKFIINKQKVKNLIKGYESIKKISLKEKKSLNILCRGAAIRYLLTRLYDYSNTPKTALIQIKDPNEYYQKLITHNNLGSYKNYLI